MSESALEIDLDPRKYVGLSFPLRADNNNDFALTKNSTEQAKHNLKNLLLTFPGERVGQPNFGSRLRALCFEQDTDELGTRIDEEIRRAVMVWLPYININDINILTDDAGTNKIFVSIKFSTNLDPTANDSLTLDVGESGGGT